MTGTITQLFSSPDTARPLDPRDHEIVFRFTSKCYLDGQCWHWAANISPPSPGSFWIGTRKNGRMESAARVSYRLFVGEIPEGWIVQQTCFNYWCVNPSHLIVSEKRRPRRAESGRPWKNIYGTPEWKAARAAALARDDKRCTVAWIFGGECTNVLHVHHIIPLAEGGEPFDLDNLGTTCSRHHRIWETLRSRVLSDLDADDAPRCPHRHRSAEARRQCEVRLARSSRIAA